MVETVGAVFEKIAILFSADDLRGFYFGARMFIFTDHQSLMAELLNTEYDYNPKSSIFWDITPCSPFKFSRYFGGTRRLYLQGRRKSYTRNQCEASGVVPVCTRGESNFDITSNSITYEGKYATILIFTDINHCQNYKYEFGASSECITL
jgi:hypothetical protein